MSSDRGGDLGSLCRKKRRRSYCAGEREKRMARSGIGAKRLMAKGNQFHQRKKNAGRKKGRLRLKEKGGGYIRRLLPAEDSGENLVHVNRRKKKKGLGRRLSEIKRGEEKRGRRPRGLEEKKEGIPFLHPAAARKRMLGERVIRKRKRNRALKEGGSLKSAKRDRRSTLITSAEGKIQAVRSSRGGEATITSLAESKGGSQRRFFMLRKVKTRPCRENGE